MMDDLKLIELVKAHKCLYDAKNERYKNAQIRDNVWKEISDEMKQPGKYIIYLLYTMTLF